MNNDNNEECPAFNQPEKTLKASADLSQYPFTSTAPAKTPPPLKDTVRNTKAMLTACTDMLPAWTCRRCLKLTFFFDGTGNNLESDIGTMEHSNVARLFEVHTRDDPTLDVYRFYIPGLGTYFKEIGDTGGKLGLGFALGGSARLQWALERFDEKMSAAGKQVLTIKVAVFGFSRGAASASAFCRELSKRCEPCNKPGGTGFKLKKHGLPIEINFLGIFDTVASVGPPMGMNNVMRWRKVQTIASLLMPGLMLYKSVAQRPELYRLAFGEGGVDPAPGPANGHQDWARDLTIPPLVKRCVHMMAAHETRNSFPVDSALNGDRYPPNVEEMIYPGAHSDVGGGYRPQEQARGSHYGDMMSLIPLHVMYERAVQSGVPLRPLQAFDSDVDKRSFAIDEEGAKHFAVVMDHFTHYMNTIGWGGGGIGKTLLAHMKMFSRWRFYCIRRRDMMHGANKRTEEELTLTRNEQTYAKEREELDRSLARKRTDLMFAQARQRQAEAELAHHQRNRMRFGTPVPPRLEAEAQTAREKTARALDAYNREADKRRTAADDSNFSKAARRYDDELLAEAEALRRWMEEDPTLNLRPHYQALVDAYQEVFVDGYKKELRDEKIIAFFDRYVHDSLAGFDTDASRRSDPRVVYIGGDHKLMSTHARVDASMQAA